MWRAVVTRLPLAVVLQVSLAGPVSATDQTFYYGIGGGAPISRPASNRSTTIRVGGDVSWSTDLMCGNFDMSVSVGQQLEGITLKQQQAAAGLPPALLQLPEALEQEPSPCRGHGGVLQLGRIEHKNPGHCRGEGGHSRQAQVVAQTQIAAVPEQPAGIGSAH